MSATVGVYVRVSRKGDREDERFHSPKEQTERASALAVARGFVPGPVFEDIDVSGATPPDERPAMRELLAAIERGELAGVAAFSLDRLSREPAHGDELVRRVTRAGGVILTPDIPDAIDSPTGEFTFGMLLQVAKLYRSQAGARFASAKERATRAGIPVGSVPFGYRQRPDRTLEVDPALAPVVRELFERRAAGAGASELAALLDEATPGRPRKWSLTAPLHIIRNRIYATGRLEYGGVVSEVDAGAIVDEALWHAAQRLENRRRPARRPDAGWLLTGLIRCDSCGRLMQPNTTRGGSTNGKRYRRYRCRVRDCPARASVYADQIERLAVLQAFAAGDELETRASAPDLGALEEAVTVAERRLEQVLAPEARDALGDLWAADVRARRLERDEALARLGEARRAAGVPAHELRLRDVWDGLSPAERRAALGLFWREVRVGPLVDGRRAVRFVARGPLAEAEVTLPSRGA